MTAAPARASAGIMLAESDSLVRPLPGLLDELCEADRQRLRGIGRDKPLESGQFVWQQGDGQTGIYLIRSGRIRSYYVAPSGRDPLAYCFRQFCWRPGSVRQRTAYVDVGGSRGEQALSCPTGLEKVALESASPPLHCWTRSRSRHVLFGDGADARDVTERLHRC